MKLEERVAEATNDKKLKNDLIGEYQNFILAAASKTLKRSVTTSDDEYIIAMMAFSDATALWGLSESTLRKAITYGKLVNGVDVCKFGKQWVVSVSAMKREYGSSEAVPDQHAN